MFAPVFFFKFADLTLFFESEASTCPYSTELPLLKPDKVPPRPFQSGFPDGFADVTLVFELFNFQIPKKLQVNFESGHLNLSLKHILKYHF